ncbi:MAG: DUF2293 domain-containing protein [Acidobacteria bacterium]|nr:DUF2293 domain-containing protein [Acidobacteriota bacterium]
MPARSFGTDHHARLPKVQRPRGTSAAAKRLDEDVVQVTVAAHVRHAETRYDDSL